MSAGGVSPDGEVRVSLDQGVAGSNPVIATKNGLIAKSGQAIFLS